jgi:hypothetical protein
MPAGRSATMTRRVKRCRNGGTAIAFRSTRIQPLRQPRRLYQGMEWGGCRRCARLSSSRMRRGHRRALPPGFRRRPCNREGPEKWQETRRLRQESTGGLQCDSLRTSVSLLPPVYKRNEVGHINRLDGFVSRNGHFKRTTVLLEDDMATAGSAHLQPDLHGDGVKRDKNLAGSPPLGRRVTLREPGLRLSHPRPGAATGWTGAARGGCDRPCPNLDRDPAQWDRDCIAPRRDRP